MLLVQKREIGAIKKYLRFNTLYVVGSMILGKAEK